MQPFPDVQEALSEAFDLRVTDITASIQIANSVLAAALESNNELDRANAESHLAYFHMIIGEHDKSMLYANTALPIFEKYHDYVRLGMLQYAIGSTYYKTDNYHMGLKHLTDSYLKYQQANDIVGQSRALKAIGTIYEFFREYDHAEETYWKCVELSKLSNDKNGVSNAYSPLSGILLRKKDPEKALEIIDKSITLKKETGDQRGLAFALYGKAKVCVHDKDYKKAEALYLESLEIYDTVQEYVGSMMCHNKLGSLYFAIDSIEFAKEHLNQVLKMGVKIITTSSCTKHVIPFIKLKNQLIIIRQPLNF